MYKNLNLISKEKIYCTWKKIKKLKSEFTIITVVKDSELTIEKTIKSVLRQKSKT